VNELFIMNIMQIMTRLIDLSLVTPSGSHVTPSQTTSCL